MPIPAKVPPSIQFDAKTLTVTASFPPTPLLIKEEVVHHKGHFDRGRGATGAIDLTKVQGGELGVGDDNLARAEPPRVLTTSNRGDDHGDELTPMGFPKIHHVKVDQRVERGADGGLLEGFYPFELVYPLANTIGILRGSGSVPNPAKGGEEVPPGASLYPELGLCRGSDL